MGKKQKKRARLAKLEDSQTSAGWLDGVGGFPAAYVWMDWTKLFSDEVERIVQQFYRAIGTILFLIFLAGLGALIYKYPVTWGWGTIKLLVVAYLGLALLRQSLWTLRFIQVGRKYAPQYRRSNQCYMLAVRKCLRGQRCLYKNPTMGHKLKNLVIWFLGIHLRLPVRTIMVVVPVFLRESWKSLLWPWQGEEKTKSIQV